VEGATEGFLLLTANRGLCGGFNTNVNKKARAAMEGNFLSKTISCIKISFLLKCL
jgi:F0F1-type ATP synthase gamma subunit